MNGKIWTELRFHGIARDGIKIPRDFTRRYFTGRKKHGIPRDGIDINGIARDGMQKRFYTVFVRYTASTAAFRMILYDCTLSTVIYANLTARHGMDELYLFIEWGAQKTKSHAHNLLHLASSSRSRAAALTTVVPLIKQKRRHLPLPSTTYEHIW